MGSNAARMQRLARKEAGLCAKCGFNPPADGRVECTTCGRETNEQSKRSRAVADGLCSVCFRNKPAPGMRMCASCRILARAAYRTKYHRQSEDT